MLSVCKSFECTSKCCGEEDENNSGGSGAPGGPGPSGPTGPTGPTGAAGLRGFIGPTGLPGQDGRAGTASAGGDTFNIQYKDDDAQGSLDGNNAYRFIPMGKSITLSNGYNFTTAGNALFLGNGYLPAGVTGSEDNIFSFTSHNAQTNNTTDTSIQFDASGIYFTMNGNPPSSSTPGATGPIFRVESHDSFATFQPQYPERIVLQTRDGDIHLKSRSHSTFAGKGSIKLNTNDGNIDLISSGGYNSTIGGAINLETTRNGISLNTTAQGAAVGQGIFMGVTGQDSYSNPVIKLETWRSTGAGQSIGGGQISIQADCNDILLQCKDTPTYVGQAGDIKLLSDKGNIQLSSVKTIVKGSTGTAAGEINVLDNNGNIGIELKGATGTSVNTINIKNTATPAKTSVKIESNISDDSGQIQIYSPSGTQPTILLHGLTGYIQAEEIETTKFTAANITALNTLKGRDIVAEGSSGTLTVKNTGGTGIFEVDGGQAGYTTTINTTGPQIFMGRDTATSFASIRMGSGPTGANALVKIDAGTTVGRGAVDISVPFKPWQASTGTLTSTTGLPTGTIAMSTTNNKLMFTPPYSGPGVTGSPQMLALGIASNTTFLAGGSFSTLCGNIKASGGAGTYITIGEVKNNNGASFANICAMGPLTFPQLGNGNGQWRPSGSINKQYLKITSQFFTTPSNQFGGLILWARYILYRPTKANTPSTGGGTSQGWGVNNWTYIPEPKNPGPTLQQATDPNNPAAGNFPKLDDDECWYVLESGPLNVTSGVAALQAKADVCVSNYKGHRLQRTDSGRAFTFTQYCTAPPNIIYNQAPSGGAGEQLENWFLILQVRDNYSTGPRSFILPQGASMTWTSGLGGLITTTAYGGPVNMSIEIINADLPAGQIQSNISVL